MPVLRPSKGAILVNCPRPTSPSKPRRYRPLAKERRLFRLFTRAARHEEPVVEEKTEQAVARTRRTWFGRFPAIFARNRIDDELWDELEEVLLGADCGVATTTELLSVTRERARREGATTTDEVKAILREEMIAILRAPQEAEDEIQKPHPAVVLVVGVNGSGKTTTAGKLAYIESRARKRVVLAAADTFRAAAIDQLRIWAERAGAEFIAHRPGADPGAVVFDAVEAAYSRNADLLLVDTAGRLHTKQNLMNELRKIQRVIQRRDVSAPHETLLVLDATTGQNGLAQARAFTEAVAVTGTVLAKLDGTARGGIVFAIADQLRIPVLFIGSGEGPEDLAPFDPETFVDALLAG